MKNQRIQFAILIMVLPFFQSCLFPTGTWSGGNGNYSYKKINTDKYMSSLEYKKEMPMQNREEGVTAPLISKKGEVNMTSNFVNGCNLNTSVGISNKMFVQAGVSLTRSNASESKRGSFETTYYNVYDYTQVTDEGTSNANYSFNRDLHMEGSAYNLAAGFYNNFHKAGRWEYMAGYSHGSTSSDYAYNFKFASNDQYTSLYKLTEKRNISQIFVQTDLGYSTAKSEGAIIARTSFIHYSNQAFSNSAMLKGYKMDNTEVVFQPALHFAYGKQFRVFFQYGLNVPLVNTQTKWLNTNVQFGIQLRILPKS